MGDVARNVTDDPFCADTPDQSWRSSRLATCTFGMPLESTQAGWYVTVGFDAALAMLFIPATRFKMLVQRSGRHHGQIEGPFDGGFSGSGIAAAPPNRAQSLVPLLFSVSPLSTTVAIWDVWIAVDFRRWRARVSRTLVCGCALTAEFSGFPKALFVWSTGQRRCAKLRPRRLSPLVDVFSWSSMNLTFPTELEVRLRWFSVGDSEPPS